VQEVGALGSAEVGDYSHVGVECLREGAVGGVLVVHAFRVFHNWEPAEGRRGSLRPF